jgi:hypothetical protein
MSSQPAPQATKRLGGTQATGRNVRRRLFLHHVPLALASAALLVVFMGFPSFEAGARTHADLTSGPFPQQPVERDGMERDGMDMDHGEDEADAMEMDHGEGPAEGLALTFAPVGSRIFMAELTVATGYVATVLLGLTLLIGPANLLLRRRNPVSSYLRRDVGTWAVVLSAVHVVFGFQVDGSLRVGDMLSYFVDDGAPLTNSFGLGNWTGLAALVIAVGLLALSSDFVLRKLKAKPGKRSSA